MQIAQESINKLESVVARYEAMNGSEYTGKEYNMACPRSCSGSCSGDCGHSCSGSCDGSCDGSCYTTCSGGAQR
ncbi:MAG: hypothetical protein U9N34_03070 [Candidatus Cloacimonadota bacterium]|nr:hypothetical protein [Candidatus Cloacimonadota bacterium]